MKVEDMEQLGREYDAKFGNLADVAHPMVVFEGQFLKLLEKALARGSAVTRSEVEEEFGPVSWEE